MRRGSVPSLAELQSGLQAAILSGDVRSVVPLVRAGAQAPRETLLGVYTTAYALRLVGILKADFPLTAAYMGDDAFARAARSYIAAHPSPHRSARWVGDRFATHLASAAEWATHRQCGDLAALEWALGLAFDAPDAPHIGLGDVASIPPEAWSDLIFQPHPSARVFNETWNAFAIWSALKDEGGPPPAHRHAESAAHLIWRRDGTPTIRGLSPEEAMLWQEAVRGTPLHRLCELAAHFDDPDVAAARVAAHVRAWLDSGALTAVAFSPSA
jgi:hypothetical protein